MSTEHAQPLLHPGGRPPHWRQAAQGESADAAKLRRLANIRLKAMAAKFRDKPELYLGTRKTAHTKADAPAKPQTDGGHALNATAAGGATWLYRMLNPHSKSLHARVYRRFITFVILGNVISFILSTDKGLNTYDDYHGPFYIIELTSSILFLIEYVLRLYTCIESTRYRPVPHSDENTTREGCTPSGGWRGPFWGRLRWMMTLSTVVDAVATFPCFLELIIQSPLPMFTYLRIFRLFRILKTERYFHAVECVWRIVYFNAEILLTSLFVCLMLLLGTGTLMYYMRPTDCPTRDNCMENFASIPRTLYLAVLMLTGQGGPDGPLDTLTKLVCAVTAIFSVAMFAIPASMLTWGFEAEAERLLGKKRLRRKKEKEAEAQGREYVSTSGTSEEDASGDSSWDEYEAVILGNEEEEEKEKEEQAKEHQQLMDVVRSCQRKLDKLQELEQQEMDRAKKAPGRDALPRLSRDVDTIEDRVAKLESSMEAMHSLMQKVADKVGA